jgi:MOSC domain-containing protein YiiM
MPHVVSVNVATPETVLWKGREFLTAIRKAPQSGQTQISGVNAAGDDQADRTVHGGPSKAIYAYAVEDYDWWASVQGVSPRPGLFGENLTTNGIDLSGALIGERWRIGTSLLEVSEPRLPCYKLGFALDDAAFPRKFAAALRPGAYFRIVEEGVAWPGCEARLEHKPSDHAISSAEVMRIRLFAHGERAKLATVEGLSLAYKGWAQLTDDRLAE